VYSRFSLAVSQYEGEITMIVCKGVDNAYYPMRIKAPGLICGTGRIRFFRGFIIVRSKKLQVLGPKL